MTIDLLPDQNDFYSLRIFMEKYLPLSSYISFQKHTPYISQPSLK